MVQREEEMDEKDVSYMVDGVWIRADKVIPPNRRGEPRPPKMSGQEFRDIRVELGLTQKAMAERIGLCFQENISRIENGAGATGPVAAHMRTLLRIHREYILMMDMTRKGGKHDCA